MRFDGRLFSGKLWAWHPEYLVLVSEPDPLKFPRVWFRDYYCSRTSLVSVCTRILMIALFGSVYYPLQRWHGVAGEREIVSCYLPEQLPWSSCD